MLKKLVTFVAIAFANVMRLRRAKLPVEKLLNLARSSNSFKQLHHLNLEAKLRQLHALKVVEHFHQKLRTRYTLSVSNGLVKSNVGFTSPEMMENERVSTCSFQALTHTLKLTDHTGTV